ncbi:hypothetical protein C8R44DRAFT_755128 [Mycena epipterygia]|nr:hypothetical protein C8R44DRAFT_755128 [Mycena epipterygia]
MSSGGFEPPSLPQLLQTRLLWGKSWPARQKSLDEVTFAGGFEPPSFPEFTSAKHLKGAGLSCITPRELPFSILQFQLMRQKQHKWDWGEKKNLGDESDHVFECIRTTFSLNSHVPRLIKWERHVLLHEELFPQPTNLEEWHKNEACDQRNDDA